METAVTKNKINWIYSIHLGIYLVLALVGLPMYTHKAFMVFLVLYVLTMFGLTFGFHRYFSHRSFKMPRVLEYFVAFLGALAIQGGVFRWVAQHRMHHAFTETDKDPHSAAKGFWFSHMGWLFLIKNEFVSQEKLAPFARDIARDPVLMFMSTFSFITITQAALFLVLWLSMGIEVAMWGVFVRILATYTVIWSINSIGHKYGYRRYQTEDFSTNNWLLGLVSFGDGFHNNHHAFANCAFHGHKWWEIDINGMFIRLLEKLGIVRDVKRLHTETSPLDLDPK